MQRCEISLGADVLHFIGLSFGLRLQPDLGRLVLTGSTLPLTLHFWLQYVMDKCSARVHFTMRSSKETGIIVYCNNVTNTSTTDT